MVSYNVTIVIKEKRHDEWLQFMNEVHIPDVMMSCKFKEYRFWKLENLDESEGITYNVQYIAADFDAVDEYLEHHAAKLQEEHSEIFGNDFVSFRSFMKLVHHGQEQTQK